MKRFLLSLCLLLVVTIVVAQDVLYKTTGDSLLVKVETVGEEQIGYRRWDNMTGPLYTIDIEKVARIRYANGVIEEYQAVGEMATQGATAVPTDMAEGTSEMGAKVDHSVIGQSAEDNPLSYTLVIADKDDPVTTKVYRRTVTRSGNTYFYGNEVMDKKAYVEFLRMNCPEAWSQAHNGYRLATAGWTLLGVGLGLDLIGLVGTVAMANQVAMTNTGQGGLAFFASCYYIGLACEIACIPTLAVGYARMHNSVSIYNVSCTKTAYTKPYWSVQASQNGIGLAYNF